MDPLDPVTALERIGGVSDGTTLRGLCDPWQLRVAVREGRVAHLGRNSYALPGAQEAPAAAARLHGTASHLSAAMVWGWKVKRAPREPVVTVPRGRKLDAGRLSGIDVRYADLPPTALERGVTTRVQTVIACARTLPFDEALAVADSALIEGKGERVGGAASTARAGDRSCRSR